MRKNISLVLVLGMLSFSLHPAYSKVDKKLEDEIAGEYKTFKGYTISGIAQQPCLAIQFVYHLQEKLQETHDKHIAEKIAAIVSEGAGVGGIDTTRQATEDERKIAYGALYEAIDDKADVPNLNFEVSLNPTFKEHQKVVHSIYKAKKDQALPQKTYHFLTDEKAYNTLVISITKNLKALEVKLSDNEQWILEKIKIFAGGNKYVKENSLKEILENVIQSDNKKIIDETAEIFQQIAIHKKIKREIFTPNLLKKMYVDYPQSAKRVLTQFLSFINKLHYIDWVYFKPAEIIERLLIEPNPRLRKEYLESIGRRMLISSF